MILYYTACTKGKYEKLARRLGRSLKKLGESFMYDIMPDLGSWHRNTRQKPKAILKAITQYRQYDAIVWVDADAIVVDRPMLFDAADDSFDVAVHRYVPGRLVKDLAWNLSGKVFNGTLYLRKSDLAMKVVKEWVAETKKHPEKLDQQTLGDVLLRVDPSRLRVLPSEYCWIERLMRPLDLSASPVVVHEASALDGKKPGAVSKPLHGSRPQFSWGPRKVMEVYDGPEIVWSGYLYDLSGYAKANRELLFRVANAVRVRLERDPNPEPVLVDDLTRRRLDAHLAIGISEKAPFLRFHVPHVEDCRRKRIIFTMMETDGVHRDMVKLINKHYNELWTPTGWGMRMFEKSGVSIPIKTVSLGVNGSIFNQNVEPVIQPATLITTKRSGVVEVPRGRRFITVCQPTFRKGLKYLLSAWKDAFPDGGDVSLVIATLAHPVLTEWDDPFELIGDPRSVKARVYHLSGAHSENAMASLYKACSTYVSTSLGEGWNMPAMEAAACGLSIILPDNTCHREVFSGLGARFFPSAPPRKFPEGDDICVWYVDMRFAGYDKRSHSALVELLRSDVNVTPHYRFMSEYSWDKASANMVELIRQLQ